MGAVTSGAQQQDMAQQAGRAGAQNSRARGSSGEATNKPRAVRLGRPEILSGPIHPNVFKVALPSVATMLLQTTNGFLDRFFIGGLNAGASALAAVTVSSSLMFALMSAGMAISVGTTALVGRFVGEEDRDQAEQATRQSLVLSVLAAIVVGALMFVAREPLLTLLGLTAAPRALALAYLNISLLGLPSLFVMLILNGVFRGLGDMKTPLWVSLGANAVHATGNYLLIFGNFGFPKMGLPGGALALVVSQVVASVLYLIFLRRTALREALTLKRGKAIVDWSWAWRIGRIGLPASVQQLLRVGSMLAFQGVLARTPAGSAAVAALGVGLVSESIAFMPGFGYSIAASAFVGQNLGARQVKRAHNGAWAAALQAIGVMSVMGVVFYVFAHPFVSLFVHQEGATAAQQAEIDETVRLAVAYLKIAAWSEPFLALGMVLTGALQGGGETKAPTLLTAFTMIAFRLPLAWLLASYLGLGAVGGWYAMSASTVLQGILTYFVFRRGAWHRVRV
jgi:putative MATE family efflux protein